MTQVTQPIAKGDAVTIGVYGRSRRGVVKTVSPTGARAYVNYTLPSGKTNGRWEPTDRLTRINPTCRWCDDAPRYWDRPASNPRADLIQVCRRHARPTAAKIWN